jgi:hypothetical protein
MSIDEITDNYVTSSERCTSEIGPGAEAAKLLRSWRDLVRGIPHLITVEERKRAAWGLVAWYERVLEGDDFDLDPPIEGLDTLIDQLALVSLPHDAHAELGRARWAIRVGEELVRWRRCLGTSGPGSSPVGPATDRLELAVEEARRHIERDP